MTTTFVVNKKDATANCLSSGCRTTAAWFGPISVTCAAAMGQTCSFHISLDAKVTVTQFCNCDGYGITGFYQFLVDGVAPSIGPTNEEGDYLFARNVYSPDFSQSNSRQSYPASVLAAVTNSNSNSHTITLRLGCWDLLHDGGCETAAHWTTMRVDVFEP